MQHRLQPTALACALLMVSPLALADVDYVDIRNSGININDGRVVVNPVNGRYAQVSTPQTSYHVEMKAGCKGLNQRLTETFVALGNAGMNGSIAEAMPPGTPRAVVSSRGNDEIGWTEVELKVPAAALGGSLDPVAVCNAWLDQRLAQGAQVHQVLAQDKTLVKPVTLSAVAACGKNGDTNDWRTKTMQHQLTVVCKAGGVGPGGIQAQVPAPPPPAMGLTKNLAVVATALTALKPETVGQCPAKLQFQGDIQVDAAGTVNYKVTFPYNANTPVQTRTGQLNFASAGSKKTPIFEFTANSGYPVGVVTLTVEQAGQNKGSADFKLTCVQGGAGNSIQMGMPKPGGNNPQDTVRPPDAPKPPLGIQAQPPVPPMPPKPTPGFQAPPPAPPSPPKPSFGVQAVPPAPPKPTLGIQAQPPVPPTPPVPSLNLKAAPVEPPPPAPARTLNAQ